MSTSIEQIKTYDGKLISLDEAVFLSYRNEYASQHDSNLIYDSIFNCNILIQDSHKIITGITKTNSGYHYDIVSSIFGTTYDSRNIAYLCYLSDTDNFNDPHLCLLSLSIGRNTYLVRTQNTINGFLLCRLKTMVELVTETTSAIDSISNPIETQTFNMFDNTQKVKTGRVTITNSILEYKKYTFGVEMETSSGSLSNDDWKNLNLKCERDGSCTGGEYITGILSGDQGLKHLQEICKILSKKCKMNHKCGLHVHIGNTVNSNENLLAVFLLCYMLQDEIFTMLPKSRRGNSYCQKIKLKNNEIYDMVRSEKNHAILSKMLYNYVFYLISGKVQTTPSDKINKKTYHPAGDKCRYDRDSARYLWVNLVPAMFILKSRNNEEMPIKEYQNYSIEFRNHSATLNFIKILNWLKICMGIINYAENNSSEVILNFVNYIKGAENNYTLRNVLEAVYPKTSKSLIDYIADRKKQFETSIEDVDNIKQEHYNIKNLLCV